MRKIITLGLGVSVFIFLTLVISINRSGTLQSAANMLSNDSTIEVDLLVVGDIMQHLPQVNAARIGNTDTFSYDECFQYVKPQISDADIAIGNLETTFAGAPYSGYPAFSAPDALADGLKNAGFDILLTANNHCIDRRKHGLERTIEVLDSKEIFHTGTFKDTVFRNQNYPFLYIKNGISFAILNYTYATNGIEVSEPNIVNYIDKKQIIKDLKKAKEFNPDFIIVIPHWGIEYQNEQNDEQEDLARLFFENGADLVVGSHPHVVQPIKKIKYQVGSQTKEGIVVYSMGNFVSNQRSRYKNGGIMTNFRIKKNKFTKTTSLIDYSYTPAWVNRQELPGDTNFFILPAHMIEDKDFSSKLTQTEKDDFNTFLKDTRELLVGTKERMR